jgi:hypothetical protein
MTNTANKKTTIDVSNYVVSENLPHINLDSPGLKEYLAKTEEILNSPKFREQLEKLTKRQ